VDGKVKRLWITARKSLSVVFEFCGGFVGL
jgi:hypothetical protein